MNLKSMVLEEMDANEQFLHFSERDLEDPLAIYSRIVNPVSYDSYEELILGFLEHPRAFKLAVRNSRDWKSFLKQDIGKDIGKIMEILESDELKKNNLYFVFRDVKKVSNGEYIAPVVLHFDEYDGRLFASRALVPFYFEYMFRASRTTSFYSENKAVLVLNGH